MLTKKISDHVVTYTPTCGTFREILQRGEYEALDLAYTHDIKPNQAHFHTGFDEIYYLLDGSLELSFYDPSTGLFWTERLEANELCIVSKHIHHKIITASKENRLCVICVPGFDETDEYLSDVIA